MRRLRLARTPFAVLFLVGWAFFVLTASSLQPSPQKLRLTAKPTITAKPPGVPPSDPGNGNPGNGNGNGQAFSLSNSKDGQPILTLSNMKPGDSATDTVTITNSGNIESQVALSKFHLQDTHPNCTNCTLSGVLDLVVEEVTNPSEPQGVYSGKLGAMPTVQVGSLARLESKMYRFTVSFPDGGPPPSNTTGDNRYQGASTSVDFVWTATRPTGLPQ